MASGGIYKNEIFFKNLTFRIRSTRLVRLIDCTFRLADGDLSLRARAVEPVESGLWSDLNRKFEFFKLFLKDFESKYKKKQKIDVKNRI